MAEVIVFGDIEAAYVTFLGEQLPFYGEDAVVAASIPNPRPDDGRLVTVTLIGGSQRNLVVDSPTLLFECWASRGSEACALASVVQGLVRASSGDTLSGITVYGVDASVPIPLPDPRTTCPRYRFTASVGARGTVLVKE